LVWTGRLGAVKDRNRLLLPVARANATGDAGVSARDLVLLDFVTGPEA
jgi:hypothetical protein